MEAINLTKLVKNKRLATIAYYRSGVIYYEVNYESNDYLFPVRLEENGNATLNKTERAITLLKYIRYAIKHKEFVKITKL